MDTIDILGQSIGLTIVGITINETMHVDKMGALVLVEKLPQQLNQRSKSYATKTIWFHGDISKTLTKLVNIDTIQ